jgi:8-oxo-dGTP diphosphatase
VLIEDDQAMLPIEVVAAVIRDAEGKVLIAKRPSDKHQGGKWEFPGGKVEKGESRRSALVRELREEIGIDIGHSARLISVYHEYDDKAIYLDVYEVQQWTGDAEGREGQPIRWVSADELHEFEFPEANSAIVEAACLPKNLKVIGFAKDAEDFRSQFNEKIQAGNRLFLQSFNAKEASYKPNHEEINWMLDTAASHKVTVMFESPPPLVRSDYYLHLNAEELQKVQEKPSAKRVSAICSNPEELFKAQRLGLDFILIGPVLTNASGGNKVIGWPMFQSLSARVNIPVYATGGVGDKDMELAREYGAQGIVN